MVPDLEKPRITEIKVRMDCKGCVQKIKKALHGINGIYDLYVDSGQQKLTIVGWADPEKVIKAINKKRKNATICAHTEPENTVPQTTEPAVESGPPAPAPEPTNPPSSDGPPAEPAPPAEPTKESPPTENPPPEVAPSPVPTDTGAAQPVGPSGPKDIEPIRIIHHWHEPPHIVTHSYNSYKPSPYVSRYAMEYGYPQSPQQYSISEPYMDYDRRGRRNGGGTLITSMFSDENPNACRIV
ncbi:leucine-rich repeat extensin-like protein 3 [Magnolia sinica]|uniref:leucine-rich repeat extensin-like protein 3 n=1 Tax=Magnolia sinica TaxID=86752 RepID=UPI002657C059|nr:leucine-rich repeat extensin-like protein 3 [Magnolia sinica]